MTDRPQGLLSFLSSDPPPPITAAKMDWLMRSAMRHPGSCPRPILHPRRWEQTKAVLNGPDTEERRDLEAIMATIAANVKAWEYRNAEYDKWLAENPEPGVIPT